MSLHSTAEQQEGQRSHLHPPVAAFNAVDRKSIMEENSDNGEFVGVTAGGVASPANYSCILPSYLCRRGKELILGQLLSLVLAGTGAIQSALYLDCNLSAPTFSMLSFYFPLSVLCLGYLTWKERCSSCCRDDHNKNIMTRQQSSASLSEQDTLSNNENETNNGNEMNESQKQMESSNNQTINNRPRIRMLPSSEIIAKQEKRNHLLTRWSQQPAFSLEHNQFYIDDGTDRNVESNDGVPSGAQSASTSSQLDGKQYSLLFGLIPLHQSPRTYLTIAFLDVYANYTTILAFKYTTITSVSLFDALAIPSAIIVSKYFFGRNYTKVHYMGVLVCFVGIVINVFVDYQHDKNLTEEAGNINGGQKESMQDELLEEEYPHKTLGDFLAIMGGLLFGIDNTLAEVTVRNGTLVEYIGCMTFFASIISFVQALTLERDEIQDFFTQSSESTDVGDDGDTNNCAPHEASLLFFGFMFGSMVNYLGISAFLQISDAAFFNLNLLTGDAWAVAFSIFAEGIIPPPLFYVALIITISGVFIYETAPSPVAVNSEEIIGEIELAENDIRGAAGREGNGAHDMHVLT